MRNLTIDDDVDDDGGSDEGGDGIEGNDATLAWEHTEQGTREGYDAAHEDSGWQQRAMIIRMEQQTGNMRNSQSDEGTVGV